MISISDNEFAVFSYLVRNFTQRLTIRSIARRLKFSPAGVFNSLKKLEKFGAVKGQKLGTGLFYSIDNNSKIADHLAAIVLVYPAEKSDGLDLEQFRHAKAAIYDKKNLLLITDNVTELSVSISDVNVIIKTEDELVELFRNRDDEIIEILKKGSVLIGENEVVRIIKSCISRF
jgi:DNA-binding Lrp family transcriptional regulator